jgi:hypothetical protein
MRPVPEPGGHSLAALAESLQLGEQQPLDRRTSARLVRTSGGSLTLSSDGMALAVRSTGTPEHAQISERGLAVAGGWRSCGAAMRA